jgi:hypothetical protein
MPIGAYINGADGLRFRPNTIALAVAAVPLVSAIGGALALIVGAARVGGSRDAALRDAAARRRARARRLELARRRRLV